MKLEAVIDFATADGTVVASVGVDYVTSSGIRDELDSFFNGLADRAGDARYARFNEPALLAARYIADATAGNVTADGIVVAVPGQDPGVPRYLVICPDRQTMIPPEVREMPGA